MSSLRVGIMAFGGAGRAHLAYYSCIPRCKVVKIYDPNPSAITRANAAAPGIEATSDLASFWQGLDAVSVCSPDATHADYIVGALSRGIHVCCEKPLTDSLEGLRRIRTALNSTTATLAVLHQMRFVPLFQKMKAVMEKGEIGPLSYLEGYYVHDLTKRAWILDDWRRRDNATPMLYAGCHFVDLLHWLSGADYEEVYAVANNAAFPEYPESDFNVALFKLRGGASAKVLVSFGSGCPQDHAVRVYGRDACIDESVLFVRNQWGNRWGRTLHWPMMLQSRLLTPELRLYGHGLWPQLRSSIPALVVAGLTSLASWRLLPSFGGEYAIRRPPVRLYEHGLSCVRALDDFIDSIDRRRPPLVDFDESAKAVVACLSAVESYRTGRPVRVPALHEVL